MEKKYKDYIGTTWTFRGDPFVEKYVVEDIDEDINKMIWAWEYGGLRDYNDSYPLEIFIDSISRGECKQVDPLGPKRKLKGHSL